MSQSRGKKTEHVHVSRTSTQVELWGDKGETINVSDYTSSYHAIDSERSLTHPTRERGERYKAGASERDLQKTTHLINSNAPHSDRAENSRHSQ